ncbi:MAG: glycerol-3-phosphate acyltransferase [Candidatus Cloacimonetes bacterium]|nr:glycerol-3-phosphate acyltransferase [Candidatus Cloacimonadota bacterium]
MNIYKVGTGHPDTENIFSNVGKSLGIFAGAVDFGKMFISLFFLKIVLTKFYPCISSQNHLLILGFLMIIGHCFPLTHKFKGGRGIFTYLGFTTFFFYTYFTIWPMVAVAIMALVFVVVFKQIRFAQYMVVLLPPFISFFLKEGRQFPMKMFIAAILMGIINFFVSKKLGEI